MSIFASSITRTVELPFDAPHTVTIRKLPGRHLERAHREHLITSVETIKRMGGPAFQRSFQAAAEPSAPGPANPLLGYDRYILLTKGIVSWSYPEPVSQEAIDDLEDDAAEWIAREILRLTKPVLFQTAEEAEATEKNG